MTRERPELTDKFPAIDGIEKAKGSAGSQGFYSPEDAVRADVAEILAMNGKDFYDWYEPRFKAVENLLEQFKLFGSVPHLHYGSNERSQEHKMTAVSSVRGLVESLQQGREYLLKIREVWQDEESST
jgi:hypothetical protein